MVRRNVDHVTIVVLRGLWDLHERGYFYCDLRPGNVRIRGRSEHRVRLMDAGSLVRRDDVSGGFPHVPAYLPPEVFWRSEEEGADALVPSLQIQAVMAGRTLFEVATGRVPIPGEPVDTSLLKCDTVSPEVADTIDGLCTGSFTDVFQGLKYLAKRTDRGRATSAAAKGPAAKPAAARAAAPAAPAKGSNGARQPITAEAAVPAAPRDLASALAAARANFKPAAAAKADEPPRPALVEAFAAAPSASPAQSVSAAKPAGKRTPTLRPGAIRSEDVQAKRAESEAKRPAPAPAPDVVKPKDPAPAGKIPIAGIGDDILPPSKAKPPSLWRRIMAVFGR